MPDLTLIHDVQSEGAGDVELGLNVWARLVVQRLRQQGGARAVAPGEEDRVSRDAEDA